MSWLENRIRRYEHARWTTDDNRRVEKVERQCRPDLFKNGSWELDYRRLAAWRAQIGGTVSSARVFKHRFSRVIDELKPLP